ncbi:hypothetical protein JCM9279_001379 [Rhodotorula babjevae]
MRKSPSHPAAPPDPATHSPLSLEVLPVGPEHRAVVGTWSRLPAELKHQVVDDVLEAVVGDSDTGGWLDPPVGFFEEIADSEHSAQDADKRKRCELARLQAVARDFRSICRLKLWQHVDLDPYRHEDLDTLLGALPFIAPTVRRIAYKDIIKHVNWRRQQRASYLDWRVRALEVLKRCTAVQTLVLSESLADLSGGALARLNTLYLDKRDLSGADLAIIYEQRALTSLSLAFHQIDSAGDGFIFDLVASMPNLKHLAVEGRNALCTQRIEKLLCVPADVAVAARLESLELVVEAYKVSFAAVHSFLALFSSSLVSLRLGLRGFAYDRWTVDPALPHIHLPHLTSLAVGGDFASTFFLHLDLPSLSFFRLDLFPTLRHDADDLISFLEAHSATLERVHLSTDAVSRERHVDGHYNEREVSDEVIDAAERACGEIGCEMSCGERGEEPEE